MSDATIMLKTATANTGTDRGPQFLLKYLPKTTANPKIATITTLSAFSMHTIQRAKKASVVEKLILMKKILKTKKILVEKCIIQFSCKTEQKIIKSAGAEDHRGLVSHLRRHRMGPTQAHQR